MNLRFVVVQGSALGDEIPFDGKALLLVGSSAQAQIRLQDEGVAKRHAQIFLHDGSPSIIDMSGDRFLLNGKRKRQARLSAGDEISFGQARLRLEEDSAQPASQPPRAGLKILNGKRAGLLTKVEGRVVLGREEGVDLAVPDRRCSRKHCVVEWRGDGFVVTDTSSNGTLLNDERLKRQVRTPIESGDRLKIGQTVIEFRAAVSAPAPAQAAAPAPPPTPPPAAAPSLAPAPPPPPPVAAPMDLGDEFEFDFGEEAPAATAPPPLPELAGSAMGVGDIEYEFDFSDDFDSSGMETHMARVVDDIRPSAVTQRVKSISDEDSGWMKEALSGDLREMPFSRVIQYLVTSKSTGELVIQTDRGERFVAVQNGDVRDAWGTPNVKNPEVQFYAIASLKAGRFTFHADRPVTGGRITKPTMSLLMEAMRQGDESST